jgi:hypothetical protein
VLQALNEIAQNATIRDSIVFKQFFEKDSMNVSADSSFDQQNNKDNINFSAILA